MLADEEAQGLNAENENINDIEEGMVRIGDMVAREFGQRKLAAHMSRPPRDPRCQSNRILRGISGAPASRSNRD